MGSVRVVLDLVSKPQPFRSEALYTVVRGSVQFTADCLRMMSWREALFKVPQILQACAQNGSQEKCS